MALSKELSHEAGSFSRCQNIHRFFSARGLEVYFPCLYPGLLYPSRSTSSSQVKHVLCRTLFSCSRCIATSPLHPCCLSPFLLLFWVNVSSVTTWLSDSHTVVFWQFWSVFVSKTVVVLVLGVQGGAVYLALCLSWLEVNTFLFQCPSHVSMWARQSIHIDSHFHMSW